MNSIHPLALFRLSVLGPLASRDKLQYGELNSILNQLAAKTYDIPNSKRKHLSRQAIEKWYYDWLKGGIEALYPKTRSDKNCSYLADEIQTAILNTKRDNPSRSINTIIRILQDQGLVAKNTLSRSTIHRFLRKHNLAKRGISAITTIERRSFVALHACDIWQGDVLHGPTIMTPDGSRKTYLVSLLDDASRLIVHCAFCLNETALDIEGVLKQAIIKRGIPKKLIIDNGAAYRSDSLQGICARLKIKAVYCKAYEPEAKGKIERYHRTFREQFLNEIHLDKITTLAQLNARLWAWLEQVYHHNVHSQLEGKTPLERYRQDLARITLLSITQTQFDAIFYHRELRYIRKDATLQYNSQVYEVPHDYVGQTIALVFDPHTKQALYIESKTGEYLAQVNLIDKVSNLSRKRKRPDTAIKPDFPHLIDHVECAFNAYTKQLQLADDYQPELTLTTQDKE